MSGVAVRATALLAGAILLSACSPKPVPPYVTPPQTQAKPAAPATPNTATARP